MLRHVLSILLLTAVVGAPVRGQVVVADPASVVAVVERFHAAMKSGDSSTINRMLAEDVVIHEGGGVESRAQYLADHLPADIEFEKAVSTKRSAIRAVVLGETAWATSTSEFVGTFQGRAVDSIGTELIVLSFAPDGWRMRAISWTGRARRPATPAAPPAQ